MNKFLVLLVFLISSLSSVVGGEIQDIKVRLFSSYNGTSAMLSAKNGIYFLIAQDSHGNAIDTITKLDSKDKNRGLLYLWMSSGKVVFKKNGVILGSYSNVNLKAADDNSTFTVRYSKQKERIYDGSLNVKLNERNIELINNVRMTSYVAGVIESEIGSKGNLEFYKVQAILVRTYALKNINKFIDKGYNLTDDVRSQVYFSKSYFSKNSKIIKKAVAQTKDMVIVGDNNNIIDPVFHANSGGQTMKAADVWNFEFPYLQSINDPYSSLTKSSSLSWKKEVSVDRYLQYFYKEAPKYRNNKSYKNAVLSFKQLSRKASFKYKDVEIPLKRIRSEFKLKSTFFNVSTKNNKVVISGKGYGHGVGLSQIGAINMGKKGFNYNQIIKFYFKGVSVVDVNDTTLAYK